MKPFQEYQIYELVQSYIKQYPSHAKLIEYAVARSVRIPGFETRNPAPKQSKESKTTSVVLDDSLRRTKTAISDIIICNKFDMFCTFTFNKKFVNRNDPVACKQKMSKWLHNQRDRRGNFEYLIVPEFHKDGKAIHFHALMRGYKGNMVPAKISKKSTKRLVYNINSYRLGFSTAVIMDDNYEKVGNYVKKYITKDMPLFPGKKRYWCSTGLIRPDLIKNPQIDPSTLLEFEKKYNNNGFVISERPGILTLHTNK